MSEGDLLDAAKCGDAGRVQRCLDAGVSVNCKDDKYGATPLHSAAWYGHKEVAGLLLGAGAAVDAADKDGYTPLHCAAIIGHKEVAGLLLGAGAAVDAADKNGKTPADVCCIHASDANKANKGAILAALAAAAAAPKAAPKQQQQQVVTVVPARPATSPPARQALPAVAAALSLYSGGTVTLAASAFKASVLGSDLLKAGLRVALQVAGSVVTANPAGLIEAVAVLAQSLRGSKEAVLWCKERAARAGDRAAALVPALQELERAVLAPGQGVEVRLVESVSIMLVLLAKALLEMKQLLLQFQKSQGGGVMKRMLHFLNAQGFRQQFEELEQELRDCLVQLSTILNTAHFTSQARVAAMMQEQRQRSDGWRQQNELDQRVDMQQLEGLMLQAVGGVEKLERQLQGQGVELRQVAEWLQDMRASSTAITAHLVQVSLQLDHLQVTVEQRFDDVDSTLQAVLAYMTTQAVPGQQQQQQPRPVFVIPRSEIRFSEADLAQAAGGAFGKVVKAARDQGWVAVKIYRHQGLGKRDRKRVVQEALLLARASHQNVVRCFGVVHDPDHPNDPSNIDGSLVMEWVYGGDLYKWLQDTDGCSFRERLALVTQVAAGMRYLHENRLVHGDLKPQNVMLQPSPAGGLPEAKICDFGLAKHASTTTASTYTPTTKAYTLEYTSPTRLREFTRSYQDDVYAFGILMYFVASCDSPFHNIDKSRLHDAILAGVRPDIDEWAAEEVSGGPAALEGVVAAYCRLAKQCWHQDPAQRPTFAAAIYPKLTALMQQYP